MFRRRLHPSFLSYPYDLASRLAGQEVWGKRRSLELPSVACWFFFFCVLGDGVTGDRKTTRGEIDDGRQEKEKAELFPEKAPQKAPQRNTALG